MTSRTLSLEVKKKKDAEAFLENSTTGLINDRERYRDGCCRNGLCCSLCGLKCFSGCQMCCLCITVFFWIVISSNDWNCNENWYVQYGTNPNPEINYCNPIENWLGTVESYAALEFFGIVCRLAIVFVFFWALMRINCLVQPLSKFGFVQSKKVLYAHIAISIIDLCFNFGVGVWSFVESIHIMMQATEMYEPDYNPADYSGTLTVLIV